MTPAPLRVWYDYQRFMSHARSARDTIAVLKTLCKLVPEPDTADVVVLHHEPGHYRRLVQDVPALRNKYVIGYGVWETDILPSEMAEGCRYVDEIWTPSTFSMPPFERHHRRVTWVPHVVHPRPKPVADARRHLGKIFDTEAARVNFLHITQDGVSRKNTALLDRAFAMFRKRAPDARLIIKSIQYPVRDGSPVYTRVADNTVHILGKLPDDGMAALLDYCDAYVSPHAAEGWGLPLADAMMARKPVVATGYSGNMDFMTPHNAYLISYGLDLIRPQQVHHLFRTNMTWAFPHRESLETRLWEVYRDLRDGAAASRVAQAYQDIQCYNPESLARYLVPHLARIREGLPKP